MENNNKSYSEETSETLYAADYVEGSKVTRYKVTKGVNYPHVELQTEQISPHIIQYLQDICLDNTYTEVKGYALYIKMGDGKAMVGILPEEKYPTLLTPIFDEYGKILRISETEEYKDDLLYAFVPPIV